MKNFKEFIDETKAIKIKSHKTVDQIAKKHRLDVSFIQNQLEMGIPIEHEHTRDKVLATDIALQHLNEIPDYYTRLKKMEASAKKEHKKFKDVKEEKGEIRYCSLCKKEESQEECKYGPAMWNINARTLTQNQIKFNTTRIHPANESVTIEDANGNTFLEVIDLIKPEKMKGVSEETKSGDSSLHDWFSKSKSSDGKPGWVQLGGRYAGKPCAKQPGQNTKPKCGSSKMAANMSDDEEDAAARRKRKEDPNPDRSGQAKNVKTEEFVNEDACKEKVKSRYKIWPSAYASGAVVKCRKVGAANWGTKSESTDSLGGDWHTPIRERADRYCPKCEKLERRTECKYGTKYWDMFSLPAEIISSKKDYNITMPYPANESATIEDIDENYLRIQTRGTTYSILLNWRGKYITSQMFFPQFTRPTKKQVTDEVRKIYPNAIVLAFNPSLKDPTKPLLFTGQTNEPR
jgi:cytochrome c2